LNQELRFEPGIYAAEKRRLDFLKYSCGEGQWHDKGFREPGDARAASTPLAMSCTCPALPNGTPVLATSFGSIAALLPVNAGGILEVAVSMTRDGPFDPDAIA
jgi:hypothetical protein